MVTQALFVATGPGLKTNLEIDTFENIEVYNLMAGACGCACGWMCGWVVGWGECGHRVGGDYYGLGWVWMRLVGMMWVWVCVRVLGTGMAVQDLVSSPRSGWAGPGPWTWGLTFTLAAIQYAFL